MCCHTTGLARGIRSHAVCRARRSAFCWVSEEVANTSIGLTSPWHFGICLSTIKICGQDGGHRQLFVAQVLGHDATAQ